MVIPQTKTTDYPNKNIKVIHINRQIINNPTNKSKLITINGIISVSIFKYSIIIEKGEMFSWEDIINKATKILINATTKHKNDLD